MKPSALALSLLLACAAAVACSADPPPDLYGGKSARPRTGGATGEKAPPRPSDVTPPGDEPSSGDTAPPPPATPSEQAAQITAVQPDSVTIGAQPQGLDVTVTGSRLSAGSKVDIAGVLLEATSTSPTSLTVRVPPNAIQAAGVMQVSVVSAANLRSNTLTFTVANPSAVRISTLNPTTTVVNNGTEIILGITGEGFVQGSTVKFNGATIPSTFQSATQLSARIPTTALTAAGRFSVTVESGQNLVSLPSSFEVQNPRPNVTALAPASIAAGAGATVVTLDGTGFVAGSEVFSGTTPLATTFVSGTRLRATVPASFTANAGSLGLSVRSPAPGGGASAARAFAVTGAQTATCQYKCVDYNYDLNECYKDWFCDPKDGCLYQKQCGGQQAANCLYKCSDYNYKPGQCHQGWICLDSGQYAGCLGQTTCP